jgi:hypothetical protein
MDLIKTEPISHAETYFTSSENRNQLIGMKQEETSPLMPLEFKTEHEVSPVS